MTLIRDRLSSSPADTPWFLDDRGTDKNKNAVSPLRIVSLFSGIGGLDHGLESAGHVVIEMCESWDPARRVLNHRFPGVPVSDDVRDFHSSGQYDLLTAGFPCVDISHAGRQRGIFGPGSGLVEHAFRVIEEDQPTWVVLENVPNILRLGGGVGIAHVLDSLVDLGYSWAYRVVDSRAFGVAQSRRRVIILASRTESPAARLLTDDAVADHGTIAESAPDEAWGFYWTEGRRGVGLVEGAIPTLKGGSTLGLPSAPAIWNPKAVAGRKIALPTIEDGEELQGFERGWTSAASIEGEPNHRWKLVGNAVTVGVAVWLGHALAQTNAESVVAGNPKALDRSRPWPDAAWGGPDGEWVSEASRWPVREPIKSLSDVVGSSPLTPLSYRATAGFMSRLAESGIQIDERLTIDLAAHLKTMSATLTEKARLSASKYPNDRTRRRNRLVAESKLRRALMGQKLRYRLQYPIENFSAGTVGLAFPASTVAVAIAECDLSDCEQHSTRSLGTRARAVEPKPALTDQVALTAELASLGWQLALVSEHESADIAAQRIASIIEQRKTSKSVPPKFAND